MYTSEQIRQIYARLGLSVPGSLTPDRKNLFQLQQAFLMTVPYENLDILAGIPLSLSEDALFDKLVTRRRGGYCFEINGFFAVLLRSIGYTVTEYLARYLRGETAIPMRRHRVLRVTANDGSEWIVDAGIGQESFRQPLPYGDTNAETDDGFRVYRLRRSRMPTSRYFVRFTASRRNRSCPVTTKCRRSGARSIRIRRSRRLRCLRSGLHADGSPSTEISSRATRTGRYSGAISQKRNIRHCCGSTSASGNDSKRKSKVIRKGTDLAFSI